jgi:hypothetical protein
MMRSFSHEIRPWFRDMDVHTIARLFDLGSYDSVTAQAEAIYTQVADGTMPCDGAWPKDRVTRFCGWIDQGHSH